MIQTIKAIVCLKLNVSHKFFTNTVKEGELYTVNFTPSNEMSIEMLIGFCEDRDMVSVYVNIVGDLNNRKIAIALCDYFGGYADFDDGDGTIFDYCVSQSDCTLGEVRITKVTQEPQDPHPAYIEAMRSRYVESEIKLASYVNVEGFDLPLASLLPVGLKVVLDTKKMEVISKEDYLKKVAMIATESLQQIIADTEAKHSNVQAFYERYEIPFEFFTSNKNVMSGLSEGSAGDGQRKNSKQHLVFKADFKGKKFGDFLCGNSKANWGANWVRKGDDQTTKKDRVTCLTCLKKMKKYLITKNTTVV